MTKKHGDGKPAHTGVRMTEQQKEKWYNNRAKVIFSLQAFPPLGIYALLRSTAFTAKQKWLVALGVATVIGVFIYSGIGAKMNQFVLGLFT
jgi:hypothetical protein